MAKRPLLLLDLIRAGVLKPPVKVRGTYHRQVFEAVIDRDGEVVFEGNRYASPSIAAGQAITKKTKNRTPGRNYFSINGWLFWRVKGRDGQLRRLSELRQALEE